MPKVGTEPIRRAEVINAALECICECGIDKTTLDMIAVKAGFSKGIIIYYFESKKKLVEESLIAFLSSYRLKIGSTITKDMQPLEMLSRVVEVSLPRMDEVDNSKINVSILEGEDKICLPQDKIAKLFVNFISKAAVDSDLREIVRKVYIKDIEGISSLIKNVKSQYPAKDIDDNKAAYAILALVYGLSFFRIVDFMPDKESDNRDIAFDFIYHLLNIKNQLS